MPLAVKQDVAAYPVDVGFLRADAVVLDAQSGAELVKQPRSVGQL
jgi:hypothetical protein